MLFCGSGRRTALRPSAAVRPRDVMVNHAVLQVRKSRPSGRLFHFLGAAERHFRHQLWLVAPEGTVLKPNSAESCPAVFAVVTLQHGHV